jgi:hypothetical protein
LDTKDFRLIPESAEAQVPTLFLQKELKDWMKETDFGDVLNEIVANLPKYGAVVVKKVKQELEVVNLHNLVNDQSADDLDDGPVCEMHVMSPSELQEMPWDKEAIARLVKLYSKSPHKNQIVVWERWGWMNKSEFEDTYDGSDELVYTLTICGAVDKYKMDRKGKIQEDFGEVLYKAEVDPEKDFPYYECHWDKIPGRWMGMGMVEKNFEAQVRVNELQNLKGKALYWTSKLLFQSRDDTVARNMLSDLTNGDILRVKSEITPIPIDSRDLAAFTSEEQLWDKNIQEASFSFETETGETLPSGTPFRLGALLKSSSGGFFNFKRENLGLFLRSLFMDVIIPSFKKGKRKKHILTIPKTDKDVESLGEKLVDFQMYLAVQQYMEKTGFSPNMEEIQAERQRLLDEVRNRPNLFFEIPDAFYDDAKFAMDLVITDEQVDMSQKLETVSNLIQLIAQNPNILADDNLRSMVFYAMNLAGVSPVELGLKASTPPMPTQDQMLAQQQQMGGGEMPVPQTVQNQQTV